MPARKSPPERKSRSGSYVPDDLRGAAGGATARLVVRCTPELAARARQASRDTGRTLAELLESGLPPVRDSLAAAREDRDDLEELRADMRGESPRAT